MAVLGSGGRIRLRREAPDPVVLPTNSLHQLSHSLYVRDSGYWSGDVVTLTCPGGLPIDAGDGTTICPDGHASYAGSDWKIGLNRTHIGNDKDSFYRDDDDVLFYVTADENELFESGNFYVYRDQLDRLSFYNSPETALRGHKKDRIPLHNVDFDFIVLGPYGSIDYQNALLKCSTNLDIGDYGSGYVVEDEVSLKSVCGSEPIYSAPAVDRGFESDNTDCRDDCDGVLNRWLWTIQGEMSEWSLNLTAQEVETTAVGEKFGDSVKSIVTGGGSIDFLVSRKTTYEKTGAPMVDPTSLMRLLLMSEKGCKADAEFWMIDSQQEKCNLLPGDLYYKTQMLVTSIAINTRATDLIAGSLNFVTVGEIRLQMGAN